MMNNSHPPRREFLRLSAAACAGVTLAGCSDGGDTGMDRPNILWITCEDASPHLGCYGDTYARTPVLDKLASEGVLYAQAFASAPVCTPARSCIITGVHACAQGTQFQRQFMQKSEKIPYVTDYLRQAGYYCSNNVKTDYNFFDPETAWHDCSNTAHWRGKESGQPFFSVFNFITSHQSQTRYDSEELALRTAALPEELRHDPDNVPLPPYYPDTPVIRENMATFHTQMTIMDRETGDILQQLEDDGLADNTIVFFYSDHGSGLPRGKRWLHDTGTQVAFIVRVPEKFRHLCPALPGTVDDRLVSFVDLAPTVLSLAGLPIPDYMQGSAFLGQSDAGPRADLFMARDRSAQCIEVSRSIRENRFHYIRNFLPHRPRMQWCYYSEPTPIRVELRRLHAAGALSGNTAWLMADSLPAEELFDTKSDPWEMQNLAGDPAHRVVLERMRERLYARMVEIRDTGLLPEDEIHRRSTGMTAYDMASQEQYFAVERILDAARLVGMGAQHTNRLIALLGDSDSGVRFWAATGLAVLGVQAKTGRSALTGALQDASLSVRVSAAEALCRMGDLDAGLPVLGDVLATGSPFVRYEAAAALVLLGRRAESLHDRVVQILEDVKTIDYAERRHLLAAVGHILHQFPGNTTVPSGAQEFYDWAYANE